MLCHMDLVLLQVVHASCTVNVTAIPAQTLNLELAGRVELGGRLVQDADVHTRDVLVVRELVIARIAGSTEKQRLSVGGNGDGWDIAEDGTFGKGPLQARPSTTWGGGKDSGGGSRHWGRVEATLVGLVLIFTLV
jgi:hypothetical protein